MVVPVSVWSAVWLSTQQVHLSCLVLVITTNYLLLKFYYCIRQDLGVQTLRFERHPTGTHKGAIS